jgi:hypothetical protein
MHPHAALLDKLFTSLDRHDHQAMAGCYHPAATFRDIAFDLKGKRQIHAMWHMICEGDLRVTVETATAADDGGRARLVDEYTFSSTGRRVRNPIDSHFRFHNGLIVEQRDECDPRAWAAMALGGVSGFLAGRSRLLRARKAAKKLEDFISHHPEYR